ncbi:hypothetical protein ACFL44_00515 [Gemmatimonadota bacterium]
MSRYDKRIRREDSSHVKRVRQMKQVYYRPLLILAVVACVMALSGWSAEIPDQQNRLRARLLFSGNTLGYIDPCECSAGLLGGLDRRMYAVEEHRNDDLPTVLFDLGNIFETPQGGPMTELGRRQARFISDEMEQMGYSFVALGYRDLSFPPEFLADYLPDLEHPPLLTNRAEDYDAGFETVPRIRLELGELTMDVFSVVEPQTLGNEGEKIVSRWEEILTRELERSTNGNDPADLQMVIANVQWGVSEEMPEWYPQIDILINGTWLLPRQATRIRDTVNMTAAGKGQMLASLDISAFARSNQREGRPAILGFQGLQVALDPAHPSAPRVKARMVAFREQLIRDGLILP